MNQGSTSTSPEEKQDLESKENIGPIEIDLTKDFADTTEEVDLEVLALLGNFPEDNIQGPELLPSIVTRWEAILKKGLDKEERKELTRKYPPPVNFKVIDAPKLNPEVQAASSENILKRDKAMAMKQHQVSCAISALGLALNKMCKLGENKESIGIISDAARLLCDFHHMESTTRKSFILTGLDKSTREGIKDTNIDEWLFGVDFPEKLKACKAIAKSGQDLKRAGPQARGKHCSQSSHLNYKGRTNNTFKTKTQKITMKPARQYNAQTKSANTQQPNFRNRQQNQHRH